eukprot:scaffold259543_cov17-Tisochrysis_lutea.AAC.1
MQRSKEVYRSCVLVGLHEDDLAVMSTLYNACISLLPKWMHFQPHAVPYCPTKCVFNHVQFFIAPLISADGVDREINAVDSENGKNLQL